MPRSMTALATRVVPSASPYDRYRSHTATAAGGRSANASVLRSHALTPSHRAATARPASVSRSPCGRLAKPLSTTKVTSQPKPAGRSGSWPCRVASSTAPPTARPATTAAPLSRTTTAGQGLGRRGRVRPGRAGGEQDQRVQQEPAADRRGADRDRQDEGPHRWSEPDLDRPALVADRLEQVARPEPADARDDVGGDRL